MQPWQALACVCMIAFGGPGARAQSPPSPADLPPPYRGGPIERALQAQDWPRAETLLVDAIERAPSSPELLHVLGSVFLVQRKPLNAAIAFKKSETLAPLDDPARFSLVLAYIALKRGDWARPELERLASGDPANVTYEYWLGRLDYDAGQYAAAVARFERVVARDPGSVRAHDNLGLCFEALNQPERALAYYRKAMELNRGAGTRSPWPAVNLGSLLRQRGELTEAESLLREAVSYDDGLAQAHYQLGGLLEQTGRHEEALTALTRAAGADPDYAAPHYALARVLRRLGRPDEANAAITTFKRLHDAERQAARP